MSEINIISRTQRIIVDPVFSFVDVLEVNNPPSPTDTPLGMKLTRSYPATINTGNKISSDAETLFWSFLLPASMKVGDHARIRFHGSHGDPVSGGAAVTWKFFLYLNNVKVSELWPIFTPTTGYGAATQRTPFIQEIDLLYQAAAVAWVWHRHSQGKARPDIETNPSAQGADGDFTMMAAYAKPLVNLANLPFKITAQNNTLVSTNISVRGFTLEHLIGP